MRITIKATGIEHTNAIDSYVKKALAAVEKVLDPNEKSILARVDVGMTTKHHKSGDIFYAEVTMRLPGKDCRAVAKADTLYAAIDAMKDDIAREVKRHHEKLREERKKGGREMKKRIVSGK